MVSGKHTGRSWVATLNKPWLHFMVLGVVLFQLQSVFWPEPKTVIPPLSEARISALQSQWLTSTGRQPTIEQTAKFIAVARDRDMLLQRALERKFHLQDTIVYQRLIRNMNFLRLGEGLSEAELFHQALSMGLHLDDEVVKRRLIQLMEQQLLADSPAVKPSTAEIAAAFSTRQAELRRPPLYSFEHLFFTSGRASEAAAIIATISAQKLDVRSARQLGSPFMQGHQFTRQTPNQLARNFGKGFVVGLEQALNQSQVTQPQPQWLGPIASAYGLHYLWLTEFEPPHDAELRDVQRQLIVDLEYAAENRALQCAIAMLRKHYDMQKQTLKGSDLMQADGNDPQVCQ
jgi:hypothetical protein